VSEDSATGEVRFAVFFGHGMAFHGSTFWMMRTTRAQRWKARIGVMMLVLFVARVSRSIYVKEGNTPLSPAAPRNTRVYPGLVAGFIHSGFSQVGFTRLATV